MRGLHYTAARALDRAAALLDTPGRWTQSVNARNGAGRKVPPDSPAAVCWCIQGAIAREMNEMMATRTDDPRRINDTYALAYQAIRDALSSPHASLPKWNDRKGRTAAEVVRVLRRAAARIRDAVRRAA